MNDLIIPTIGTSGLYELKPPMDRYINNDDSFTCRAVRTLGEYLANNENPKVDIYDKYKIPEVEYKADVAADMLIVSLQSDKGFWLYVPARYILRLPLTHGTPYRSIAIGVSLPSLPEDIPLNHLETSITNVIHDTLGVTPNIQTLKTSRTILVTRDKHDELTKERMLVSGSRVTDRTRHEVIKVLLESVLDKIRELDAYILARMPWKPVFIQKPVVYLPEELWKYNRFTASALVVSGGRFVLNEAVWELYRDDEKYPFISETIIEGDMFSWVNPEELQEGHYSIRVKFTVRGIKGRWSDRVNFEVTLPYIVKPSISIVDIIRSRDNTFLGSDLITTKGKFKLSKAVWEVYEGDTDITDRKPLYTYETNDYEFILSDKIVYDKPYQIRVQYQVNKLDSVWSDVLKFTAASPTIVQPTIKLPKSIDIKDNIYISSDLVTTGDEEFKLKEAKWEVYDAGVTEYIPDNVLFTTTTTGTKWTSNNELEYGKSYQVRVQYIVDDLAPIWSEPYVFSPVLPKIVKPTVTVPDVVISPVKFKASMLETTKGEFVLANVKWELYKLSNGTETLVETITNTDYEWSYTKDLDIKAGVKYGIKVTYSVDLLESVSSDMVEFVPSVPGIVQPTITIPGFVTMTGNVILSSPFKVTFGKFNLTKAVWSLKNLVTGEVITKETTEPKLINLDLLFEVDYELTVTYHTTDLEPVTSEVYKIRTSPLQLLKPNIAIKSGKIVGSDISTNFGKYSDVLPVKTAYTTQESKWRMIDTVTQLDVLADTNNTVKTTSGDTPDIRNIPFDTEIMIYGRPYDMYVTYTVYKADGTKVSSAESSRFQVTRTVIRDIYHDKIHVSDYVLVPPFVENGTTGILLDVGTTGVLKTLASIAFTYTFDCIYVGYEVELEITNPSNGKSTVVPPMSVLLSDLGYEDVNVKVLKEEYPEFTFIDSSTVGAALGVTGRLNNDWGDFTINIKAKPKTE